MRSVALVLVLVLAFFADALTQEHQLTPGQRVRVRSRRGELEVTACVTERSRPGSVFMAFHHEAALTNLLTSPGLDEIALTPEYKDCAVSISSLE